MSFSDSDWRLRDIFNIWLQFLFGRQNCTCCSGSTISFWLVGILNRKALGFLSLGTMRFYVYQKGLQVMGSGQAPNVPLGTLTLLSCRDLRNSRCRKDFFWPSPEVSKILRWEMPSLYIPREKSISEDGGALTGIWANRSCYVSPSILFLARLPFCPITFPGRFALHQI